jgi:hypothetical protein
MPTNTARLALAQPVGADAASEFRVAMTSNTATLDNAAIYKSGTLASRPATPAAGTFYYATDTGLTYWWNGTAWLGVPLQGAWTALTLPSTISADGTTWLAGVRVEGNVARLRGSIYNNGSGGTLSSGTTVATLPFSVPVIVRVPATGAFIRLIISGTSITTVVSYPASGLGNIDLDGMTWTIS